MRSTLRRLWIQIGSFLLLLIAIDAGIDRYGKRHFTPYSILDNAKAAGNLCVGIVGSSEMVTAYDERAFKEALAPLGDAPCIANLAIGGTGQDIGYFALREYWKSGHSLRLLVIGFRGFSLIEDGEYAPGYYFGNNAAAFEWGNWRDLAIYFPNYSFAYFDNLIRFAIHSHSGLGVFAAAIWANLRRWELDVGVRKSDGTVAADVTNAFLEVAKDMAGPEENTPGASRGWKLDRWTERIVSEAKLRKTPIFFLRLPAAQKEDLALRVDEPVRRSHLRFLTKTARSLDGDLINLMTEPWVQDSLFVDGIHFSPQGAKLISATTGRYLRDFQSRPSRDLTEAFQSKR